MTDEQKAVIQAIIHTLNTSIPVVTKADLDAKLGCILALEKLAEDEQCTE